MPDSYFTTVTLTTNLNLNSNDLKGNINSIILNILKKKYEGVCNKEGYIIRDSIELISRSIGQIKTIDSESFINYNITYSCDIISPSIDNEYMAHVDTINKLGIISYLKLTDDDTIETSPFIIITPKEYIEESHFNKLKKGDEINIKIKTFRTKYSSKHIQIVSTLV